jgi:hypothetical protein
MEIRAFFSQQYNSMQYWQLFFQKKKNLHMKYTEAGNEKSSEVSVVKFKFIWRCNNMIYHALGNKVLESHINM